MIRKAWLPLAMGVFLAAGPAVWAEPPDGPAGGDSREEKIESIKKELNLTDDQVEKLKAHRQENRQKAMALWQEAKGKREALKAELEKEKVDERKVRSIHNDMKSTQNKLADLRLEGILEVRKILTVDQFKKFEEKMGEHRGMGMGMRGGHGDHHQGDKDKNMDKDH